MYAKGSVIHMLSGHAFPRAVCAYIFTSAALICVLMTKSACMDKIKQDYLESLYKAVLNQEQNAANVADEECIKQLSQMIL